MGATGTDNPRLRAHDEPLSIRHLAHELNSLLDGAMRYLRLAADQCDPDADERGVRRRLAAAEEALVEATDLLERVMRRARPTIGDLGADDRPLGATVEDLLRLVGPEAEAAGVQLHVQMAATAASLPNAGLGRVLHNALRNAIAAAGAVTGRARRVDVTAAVTPRGELRLLVCDSGPGLADAPATGGHGLGLDLCGRLVDALGGRCRLVNAPYGQGAVLEVHVPAGRLERR